MGNNVGCQRIECYYKSFVRVIWVILNNLLRFERIELQSFKILKRFLKKDGKSCIFQLTVLYNNHLVLVKWKLSTYRSRSILVFLPGLMCLFDDKFFKVHFKFALNKSYILILQSSHDSFSWSFIRSNPRLYPRLSTNRPILHLF